MKLERSLEIGELNWYKKDYAWNNLMRLERTFSSKGQLEVGKNLAKLESLTALFQGIKSNVRYTK